MAAPSRFYGINTEAGNLQGLTSWMPFIDPTKYITFFDDFMTYTAGDWTVTETGTATQALADGLGGWLLVTNAAADNDASFSQKVGEPFLWSSTKNLFFKSRFKVSDATQSDVVIGLQITDTTPLDTTDGFFFLKADGAATANFLVEKNNTATTTSSVATLADDTFITLGFWYNPANGLFQIYVNDAIVGTSVNTNAVDDEEVTISFGIQNGEAVAKTMTLDYIFAALER